MQKIILFIEPIDDALYTPLISKSKRVLTSRQKRLQADAIQAAKDAEEVKLKQLEKTKNDSVGANGRKKNGKTHFKKSQKPARL